MNNCDVWGYVDFGDGVKSRVRCTQLGEHDEHFCHVAIDAPPIMRLKSDEDLAHERHNVFNRGSNG